MCAFRARAVIKYHIMEKNRYFGFKKPIMRPRGVFSNVDEWDPCLFSNQQPHVPLHEIIADITGASSLADLGSRPADFDSQDFIDNQSLDITSDFRKNGFDWFEHVEDSSMRLGEKKQAKQRIAKLEASYAKSSETSSTANETATE